MVLVASIFAPISSTGASGASAHPRPGRAASSPRKRGEETASVLTWEIPVVVVMCVLIDLAGPKSAAVSAQVAETRGLQAGPVD